MLPNMGTVPMIGTNTVPILGKHMVSDDYTHCVTVQHY